MNRLVFLYSTMIVIGVASFAQARVGKEYHKWAVGEFGIPEDIRSVTSLAGLQPFLTAPREFTRMAGVRRLGEIQGPAAVPRLLEIFGGETSPEGPDYVPLVKLEVIRTLQRIGTAPAKSAVLTLVDAHLRRAENVKTKDISVITDLIPVGRTLLVALGTWRDDEDVFKLAERTVMNTDGTGKILPLLGQEWWELYLYGVVKKRAPAKEGDLGAVGYLLDLIYTVSRQGRDVQRLDLVRAHAAITVLGEMSPDALSTPEDEIKKELRALEESGVRNDRYSYLRMAAAVVHEAKTKERAGWMKKAREMAISKAREEK